MFDDRHRRVLTVFCDVLVAVDPTGPDAIADATAEGLGAVKSIEKAVDRLPVTTRRRFARLLLLFDNPLLAFVWTGRFRRLSRLESIHAAPLLERWSVSRISPVRRAFDIVKRVALLQAYGSEAAIRTIWSDRGYAMVQSGVQERPRTTASLPISCETLVIGSGAGGAVAAARLAEKGQHVVVLDKGPEAIPSALNGVETRAMNALFEQGGLLTTSDGGMSLFAGSCIGGGTTINWSASFRLPETIRNDWARAHGIEWMQGPLLADAYARIEARTNVGKDRPPDNPPNAALRRGGASLGIPVHDVPQNTMGCVGPSARDCGRCGLGCAWGRKQGVAATFLRDVVAHGGSVVSGAEVTRILLKRGRAIGAEVQVATRSGIQTLEIRADRVVVAAGALHTPAILLRSGLAHLQIGRNLHLHPTVGVAGRYAATMNGWEGPIMSSYTQAFAFMDGPWGVRIETPPIYPGLFASALPWNSSQAHKQDLSQIANTAAFIVLTRDRRSGMIGLDRKGHPVVNYRMADSDLAMLLTGVIEAARIHQAAGAEAVLFPHSKRKVLDLNGGVDRMVDLARDLFTWGWRPGYFPLFSAHQMGTCRMGGNARMAPVDPSGRLRGVEGLYVADASLFPEASGVNPALTIQALAHCVASQIQ